MLAMAPVAVLENQVADGCVRTVLAQELAISELGSTSSVPLMGQEERVG